MSILDKICKIRQNRPEKMALGPWPPDNVKKTAAYYTAKELADTLANAKELPVSEEQNKDHIYILGLLYEIAIILQEHWPEGLKQAQRHCPYCGHYPKHQLQKWTCEYCGKIVFEEAE